MRQDVYVDSVCESGLHQCIVEGDGLTVWMYLHDLETRDVLADVPVCSFAQLIPLAEFKKKYKGGGAPPLVKEYSTPQAIIADLTNDMFELRWAKDGISVLALVKGEPVSMIIKGEEKGYSKAVSKDGPWGHPWNQQLFKRFKERS